MTRQGYRTGGSLRDDLGGKGGSGDEHVGLSLAVNNWTSWIALAISFLALLVSAAALGLRFYDRKPRVKIVTSKELTGRGGASGTTIYNCTTGQGRITISRVTWESQGSSGGAGPTLATTSKGSRPVALEPGESETWHIPVRDDPAGDSQEVPIIL